MPVLLALASALCFGLGLVLTQFGLRHLPPRRGALVSVPSSAALLWLLAPEFADWRGFVSEGALVFPLVGLFFPASVTLLTFEANRHMGPNLSGALGNLAPLFAVLLATLLFGERVGAAQAFGIAAILVGVAALTLNRRALARPWPWWAVLLPLTAATIRGSVQPVTKLGLGFWPSPFAAVLLGYSVSALVI
jgi:drug/metabolite transporter (DMT)-like permease